MTVRCLPALDAQRALGREDFSTVEGLRVRMALHAGNGARARRRELFGPAVNRVARVLAVGHGGQVLLSEACAELIGGELLPECSLRDLGEHRLKDLTQPERIHQLLAPDLIADFPPLRSLRTPLQQPAGAAFGLPSGARLRSPRSPR